MTAEIIAEHPEYHPGDMAGLSGLQARYDEQLRGTPGVSVDAVPETGNPRELYRTEATPGDPLVLSLDLGLETKAEELLAGVGPASALVAIRPSTGEILAAANGPGNGGQNLATFGQAAPGSTFKTVSSLALLRAGLTPDTVVPCTPTITVDGKEFKNYSDYPASALGNIPFGRPWPTRATPPSSRRPRSCRGRTCSTPRSPWAWASTTTSASRRTSARPTRTPRARPGRPRSCIGQGTILASPMVMATVIASVQQGSLVVPRLVEGSTSSAPEGARRSPRPR